MPPIRIKICGITRPQDAAAAAQLGADAVGLVFYPRSKRSIQPAQAQAVIRALPPFCSAVGLFVNETAAHIREILAQVPLDILQFHGDEPPDFCRQFARPYLKAIRVRQTADILAALRDYPDARALLFDAHVDGTYGGTGQTFDWTLLPPDLGARWILSGGLDAANITNALRQTRAPAADVSSGVESAPGIKSHEKMAAFLAACRAFQAA